MLAGPNGVGESTVGTWTPALRAAAGVSRGAFGGLLGGFPLGLLIGGVLTTKFGDRLGMRRTLTIGGFLYWGAIIGIGVVLWARPPASVIAGAILVLWTLGGVGNGAVDGLQNAAGKDCADRYGGDVLRYGGDVLHFQAFQGVWTLAGLLGGLIGLYFGFPVYWALLLAGASALTVGVAGARLMPQQPRAPKAHMSGAKPVVGFWTLVGLGVLVGMQVVPLGVGINWLSSLGLQLAQSGAKWMIGAAVVPFGLAQLIGMLAAARFRNRHRREARVSFRLARRALIAEVAGVVLISVAIGRLPHPIPDGFHTPLGLLGLLAAGFLAVGLGTSVFPGIVQDAAGNIEVRGLGDRRRQSFVTTLQYGIQAAAPILVGYLSDLSSYGTAGAIVVVLAISTAASLLLFRLVHYADRRPEVTIGLPRPPKS